jgi:hemerythrin superfamily protein
MSDTPGTPTAPSQDDVITILLGQHARIRELFAQVRSAQGTEKQQTFDELRQLLAAHETAEEMVLRPVTLQTAGKAVADARNDEEADANRVLARLEQLDVSSTEFDTLFVAFETAVLDHARSEEAEEFPAVRAGRDRADLEKMGRALRTAETIAPTHPHPSTAGSPTAQWTVGPFASLVDRARDAIKDASSGK